MIDIDKIRLESEPMVEHLVNSFFMMPNGDVLTRRPDLLVFTLAMFNFGVLHGYPTISPKDIQRLEDAFLVAFEEIRILYNKFGDP